MSSLIEIPQSDWLKLRDLYKNTNWPENRHGYGLLNNYIQWFSKDPNIKNFKIYSLNNDWSDGTFIIIDRYCLFFNTLNENHNRLAEAFSLLDWKTGYLLCAYREKFRPVLHKFLESAEINYQEDRTILYYLPKSEAAKFEIEVPDGFTLKPMQEDHALIANEIWPHRDSASVFLLKRFIRLSPNIGIFKNNNELIAWSFTLQFGGLGALQVKDEYKRCGFGSLTVKAMSKLYADMGHDVVAPVVERNYASRKMFEKLGFVGIDQIYWSKAFVKPFEWYDD